MMKIQNTKKFDVLLVGFGIVCMIVGLVSLAQSTVPSGGPYYLQVPVSTWAYLVDRFSNGSYYMVNGTNWKVDYQGTNITLVEQYALGNMTSGTLYLNQQQHNSSLTVPANVMVIEDYQGEISYFSVVRVGVLNASESYVQAYNLLVENGTSFPSTVSSGYLFFRTDYNMLTFYNGTGWTNCTTVADDDSMYLLTSSSTNFLLQNGTRALTANWNAGAYGIYGLTWLNSTNISTNYVFLGSLTSDPVSPTVGQIWYRSDTEQFKAYNGSVIVLGSGATGPAGTVNGLPFRYTIFQNVTATYLVNGTTGAIDDSSTTENNIFINAIGNSSSGGRIFVKDSLYEGIHVHLASNIHLVGESWNTILKLADETDDSVLESTGTPTGIIVENLAIDGNYAAQSTPDYTTGGIFFSTVSNTTVKNCYIHDVAEHAIRFNNGGSSNLITDNLCADGRFGILYYGEGVALKPSRSIISNNFVYNAGGTPGNTGTGIFVREGFNVVIEGNHLEGCVDSGIEVNDGEAITVTGNSIHNNAKGIIVRECKGVAVTGNTINYTTSGTSHVGIHIWGHSTTLNCTDWTVSGNTITYCNDEGIRIENACNGSIMGNTVSHGITSTADGMRIEITGSVNWTLFITVTGNTFLGNPDFGIQINPAASYFVRGLAIIGNILSSCNKGIGLSRTENSTITGNIIMNNLDHGIASVASDFIAFVANVFAGNGATAIDGAGAYCVGIGNIGVADF